MEVLLPETLEIVRKAGDQTSQSMKGAVTVKFGSSNSKIATIDSKGNITAKKAGTVTITTTITLYSGKTRITKTKLTIK